MVIHTFLAINRQSSPMARGEKHGHPHLLCHPETIRFDCTQRQNMVIRTLFAIQIQLSPMSREDKTCSSAPSLPSRDDQVRWHAETKHGHPHLHHPETIKSDGMRRLSWSITFIVFETIIVSFAIQRQSSPMACGDHHGHLLSLFSRLL